MNGGRDAVAGLRLAVGTLTIVPVGLLPPVTLPVARSAMLLAPVAALPLGVGTALGVTAGHLAHLPPLVTAALLLAGLGWATRGMHWDGLADTADGLAAGWDRDRALEIMRRGDAGPIAAGVLSLVLLIDAGALAALLGRPHSALLVGAVVVAARTSCAYTGTSLLRAARPDGLGVAVAGSVPILGTLASAVVAAAVVTSAGIAAGVPTALPVVAIVVMSLTLALLLRRCHRSLGGVTGDVMGAGIELAMCTLLVVLCAGVGA